MNFTLNLGYKCNYECSHCCNNSGPNRKERLSKNDILEICDYIAREKPKWISFLGGEPTLYINQISILLDRILAFKAPSKVSITTNGWFFLKDTIHTKYILRQLERVNRIQVSIDRYHPNAEMLISNLQNRADDCNLSSKIEIVSVWSNAEDLIWLAKINLKLRKYKISIQEGAPSGRAKISKNYLKREIPRPQLQNMACPNLTQVAYHPNTGFTKCCGPLANKASLKKIIGSEKYRNFVNLRFTRNIERKKLSELASEYNVDLSNETFSHPCEACEYIFSKCVTDKLMEVV